MTTVAIQLIGMTIKTSKPHRESQIRWGITSRPRKNTVSRLRLRSSETTRRMGWVSAVYRFYGVPQP